MPRREFKKPKKNVGSIIGAPTTSEIEDASFDYPIFCFRHLDNSYGLSNCNADDMTALLTRLAKLSTMSWNDIKLADRHGLGSEKIFKTSIRASFPSFISDDVDHLLAFRFNGLAPFLGHRNKSVLHIIFIDSGFSLYDHGN